MIPARRNRYGENDPFLVSMYNFNSYFPHFDDNMSHSSFRARLATLAVSNPSFYKSLTFFSLSMRF